MTQTIEHIVEKCRRGDREAQKELYSHYAPTLLGMARRYFSAVEDAEDILMEAFYKIFTNMDQYKGEGSFEGWMKRILVNEALMRLRRHRNFALSIESEALEIPDENDILSSIQHDEIIELLDHLPTGYRTIFNMYVIEGYKHREIADVLNISINTSKSQLIQAKKKLGELLKKKMTISKNHYH